MRVVGDILAWFFIKVKTKNKKNLQIFKKLH